MDRFALALGVTAGLVQLAGYWQYNRIMVSDKDHRPNTASWFMWTIGAVVEYLVFRDLVQDWGKEVLPLACTVGLFLTFMHVSLRYGFKLRWRDWSFVTLDAVVVAVWVITDDPYISNLFLGVDIAITFWPVLTEVWKNPFSEHPKPWATWSVAYGLLFLVVLLKWENGYELIYPGLYFIFHLAVWWLASSKRRRPALV